MYSAFFLENLRIYLISRLPKEISRPKNSYSFFFRSPVASVRLDRPGAL